MTVLRKLDAGLKHSKQTVLDLKSDPNREEIIRQEQVFWLAAGQAFYISSGLQRGNGRNV
jgi:hypothetical protein